MTNINKKALNVTKTLSRRQFLQIASSSLAMLSFPEGRALASQVGNASGNKKVIWLLLRGGLDSLHTIIPTFDEAYKTLRPNLSKSLSNNLSHPLLPLDKGFALHPALKSLHRWYKGKQLLPIVAVSSGYQQRSHFDAQDYLESGLMHADPDTGWLGRAIEIKLKKALAISRSTPISLRDSNNVNTWYPTNLKNADLDIYQGLNKLYQADPLLLDTLQSGMRVRGLVGNKSNEKQKRQGKFIDLAKACGKLINADPDLSCAMLELGGWDTHNNQEKRLNTKLSELDAGISALREELGTEWGNTVVIIATEFGRTAKENGTKGTDHGTASALLLTGGAISGGKVLGQWPGLQPDELHQGRDLKPTSNSFAWIASILKQHWQFSDADISKVFPHIKPYKQTLIS